MRKRVLEVCVDSLESAEEAKLGGADRLELCGNLMIGGTTPEYELFEQIKEETGLEIRVLIRPRFGDFLYSEKEMGRMETQIRTFVRKGADGVVTGALTAEGDLNLEAMKRFMEAAEGRKVTLHRAFDMCKDPFRTLEEAKKTGVSTILTSGQEASCKQGKQRIKQLLEGCRNTPEILIGGGVTPEVIREFLQEMEATSFHMSGKKVIKSEMQYINKKVNMGLPGMDEYSIWRTDRRQIQEAARILKEV